MVNKEECEAILNGIGTSAQQREIQKWVRLYLALLAENANLKRDKERLRKALEAIHRYRLEDDCEICDCGKDCSQCVAREALSIDAAMQGKSAALDSGEES